MMPAGLKFVAGRQLCVVKGSDQYSRLSCRSGYVLTVRVRYGGKPRAPSPKLPDMFLLKKGLSGDLRMREYLCGLKV